MADVTIRSATADDAELVAEVYLASRKAFLSFAPLTHSEQAVRRWIADRLIPTGGVTVAEDAERRRIVGMLTLTRRDGIGWIDHLYVLPAAVGQGLGTRLLGHAKVALGPPICLYTFQANDGARRFYERHGFRVVAFGDGSGNEEGCPDVLYEWGTVSTAGTSTRR
jgi:ribosomal protein S18 acetylase RimI-like enzyme